MAHSAFCAHGWEYGKDSNAGLGSSKGSLIKKNLRFVFGSGPVDCCKVLQDWDDHNKLKKSFVKLESSVKEEICQPEQSNKFWFLNLEGQLELVKNAPFRNVNNSNVLYDNKHLDYSRTLKEVKKEEVEVKVELYKPLKPIVTIKPLKLGGTAEIATYV